MDGSINQSLQPRAGLPISLFKAASLKNLGISNHHNNPYLIQPKQSLPGQAPDLRKYLTDSNSLSMTRWPKTRIDTGGTVSRPTASSKMPAQTADGAGIPESETTEPHVWLFGRSTKNCSSGICQPANSTDSNVHADAWRRKDADHPFLLCQPCVLMSQPEQKHRSAAAA